LGERESGGDENGVGGVAKAVEEKVMRAAG
jgi:hypothetical protein